MNQIGTNCRARLGARARARGGKPKPFLLLIMLLLLIAFLPGCTSLNSAAFNSENTLADLATGAGHSFNVWYNQQTNHATATELDTLNGQRAEVYAGIENVGRSLAIAEALRQAYATNSASTNAAALTVGLEVLGDQATNVVQLVRAFMAPQKQ